MSLGKDTGLHWAAAQTRPRGITPRTPLFAARTRSGEFKISCL